MQHKTLTRLLSSLALILLLAPGTFLRDPPSKIDHSQYIAFTAISLRGTAPADAPLPPQKAVALGAFDLVNAWEMRSTNSLFWGMSSLVPRADGGLMAATDNGWLIGFTPPGRPRVQRDFIVPLPSTTGIELAKADRDAESMTFDPVTRRYWGGFESSNAIVRFAPSFARQEADAKPAAMANWRSNSGPEAFVRLTDGRFVIISEGTSSFGLERPHPALLFHDDPADGAQPVPFSFAAIPGFRPTDMAQLPDGRVLILLRKTSVFSGFTAKIMLADPAQIVPGETWQGREVAWLKPPLPTDNMEGMTITRESTGPHKGQISVWLISDSNKFALQRNLLLQLLWRPERLEE